jgi:nitrite reductase/ring-hydroxylating ferredoxin subunit
VIFSGIRGAAPPGSPLGDRVDSGPVGELFVKGRIVVRFGDTEVLVVRTRRKLYAIENRCPHLGRQLADAPVTGQTLTCPDHGRRYDLASGRSAGHAFSRAARLRAFDVAIAHGRVWLAPKQPRDSPPARDAAR